MSAEKTLIEVTIDDPKAFSDPEIWEPVDPNEEPDANICDVCHAKQNEFITAEHIVQLNGGVTILLCDEDFSKLKFHEVVPKEKLPSPEECDRELDEAGRLKREREKQ